MPRKKRRSKKRSQRTKFAKAARACKGRSRTKFRKCMKSKLRK